LTLLGDCSAGNYVVASEPGGEVDYAAVGASGQTENHEYDAEQPKHGATQQRGFPAIAGHSRLRSNVYKQTALLIQLALFTIFLKLLCICVQAKYFVQFG
jgi:hypothetical protein